MCCRHRFQGYRVLISATRRDRPAELPRVQGRPFDKLRTGSFDQLRTGSFDQLRTGSFGNKLRNEPGTNKERIGNEYVASQRGALLEKRRIPVILEEAEGLPHSAPPSRGQVVNAMAGGLRPHHGPPAPHMGATPTRAAICLRPSVPSSGRSASSATENRC